MLSRVFSTTQGYIRNGCNFLYGSINNLDSSYKSTIVGIFAGTVWTGANSASAIVSTTTLAVGPHTASRIKLALDNPEFQLDHLGDIDSYSVAISCIMSRASEEILLPLDLIRCGLGCSLAGTATPIGRLLLGSGSQTVGVTLLHCGGLLYFNTAVAASLIGLQTLGLVGDCDDENASAATGTALAFLTIFGVEVACYLYRRREGGRGDQ